MVVNLFNIMVAAMIVAFVVTMIVFAVGKNVYGDMDVSVERIQIKYMKQPWHVVIESKKKSVTFFMLQNRTRPFTAEFRQIRYDQPVIVSVRNFYADLIDCEMTFTAENMEEAGRLSRWYEYTPNSFCSLRMSVKWNQTDQ